MILDIFYHITIYSLLIPVERLIRRNHKWGASYYTGNERLSQTRIFVGNSGRKRRAGVYRRLRKFHVVHYRVSNYLLKILIPLLQLEGSPNQKCKRGGRREMLCSSWDLSPGLSCWDIFLILVSMKQFG